MIHSFSEACGSTFPLVFRRANELQSEPRLFFHDESLDKLIDGLRLGQLAFFYGSRRCLAISELLCVRSQLDSRHGGLNSDTIFIDGGNSFDPYLLVQYTEEDLLDRNRTLDRTLVSRAFTCYQLTSLITQLLPRAVHEGKIKLVVVSDVIDLYCDPDLRNNRSIDVFKTALNTLVTTARAERTIVVTTSLDKTVSGRFLHAIKQRVDIVVRFEGQESFTKLTLEASDSPWAEPNNQAVDNAGIGRIFRGRSMWVGLFLHGEYSSKRN